MLALIEAICSFKIMIKLVIELVQGGLRFDLQAPSVASNLIFKHLEHFMIFEKNWIGVLVPEKERLEFVFKFLNSHGKIKLAARTSGRT